MQLVISFLLAITLILPFSVSNFSSTAIWQTLTAQQPLPTLPKEGYVDHDGTRIWHGTVGEGESVVLLHGGMESSLSWEIRFQPW
jgi:hypothetical protein